VNAPHALVAHLNAKATAMHPLERLKALRKALTGEIVFTTTFGAEDQAITHMIATANLDIAIVTIDTGRLFPQTHDVWARTEAHYGIRVRPLFPDADALETLVMEQGVNGFYRSVAARKTCCEIRISDPLSLALVEAEAWVSGDPSNQKKPPSFISLDEGFKVVKMNPVFDWTHAQALAFAVDNHIPVNELHSQGFIATGCAPCTRAVDPTRTQLSPHWWWEDEGVARRADGGSALEN